MKLKKLLLGLIAGTVAIASLAFVACSDGGNGKEDNKEDGPVTISYQLSGKMDGEDLTVVSFARGAFWLKLMSDGTAVMDRYNFGGYNSAPAAENEDYIQNYMQGEWEETVRDGVEALSVEVYMLNEAGIKLQASNATAYNSNGVYSCSFRMEVVTGSGFYRQVEFTGGKTLYSDADEFIQDYALTFEAPASVAVFKDEENGGTVYLQEGGKALIYNGYSQIAEGTWSNDKSGNMTLTVNGEKIEVAVDAAADTATFDFNYTLQAQYAINFVFTAKYSEIPEHAAAVQENVYTGTYNNQTWTLKLTDASNCVLSTTMSGFNVPLNGTYTKDADGIVTITCNPENKNLQTIWLGVSNVRWKLNEEDHTMTPLTEEK